MRFLLDTHVLIWMTLEPDRLSDSVAQIIQDRQNSLFLSMASIWEMQIKLQVGKLNLQLPLQQVIADQKRVNELRVVMIEESHVYGLGDLPGVHKDPFDRLLIAQARVEGMPVVSVDEVFDQYPVERVW